MTKSPRVPLELLRRQVAWFQVVGLLAVLVPAALVWSVERKREDVRHRVAAFHDPSLDAAQEALMAIDRIHLARAPLDEEVARSRVRQRGFYFRELELRLNSLY